MAIQTTVVRFLNTEGTITLSGDFSVETLRSRFSSAFTWISNADAEVTQDGDSKTVVFKERVADKGASL